jgi:hypothetical protein
MLIFGGVTSWKIVAHCRVRSRVDKAKEQTKTKFEEDARTCICN